MTKIFSAVFFAVCLITTWYLVKSGPAISYQTHADMQATMAQVISAHLKAAKPEAKDFRILELKSEVTGENTVRVFFQYEFSEVVSDGSAVKTQRTGITDLMKVAAQEGSPQKWAVREGSVKVIEGLVFENDPALATVQAAEPATAVPVPPTATPTSGAGSEHGSGH